MSGLNRACHAQLPRPASAHRHNTHCVLRRRCEPKFFKLQYQIQSLSGHSGCSGVNMLQRLPSIASAMSTDLPLVHDLAPLHACSPSLPSCASNAATSAPTATPCMRDTTAQPPQPTAVHAVLEHRCHSQDPGGPLSGLAAAAAAHMTEPLSLAALLLQQRARSSGIGAAPSASTSGAGPSANSTHKSRRGPRQIAKARGAARTQRSLPMDLLAGDLRAALAGTPPRAASQRPTPEKLLRAQALWNRQYLHGRDGIPAAAMARSLTFREPFTGAASHSINWMDCSLPLNNSLSGLECESLRGAMEADGCRGVDVSDDERHTSGTECAMQLHHMQA